jgi:hypothetical protein
MDPGWINTVSTCNALLLDSIKGLQEMPTERELVVLSARLATVMHYVYFK